MSTSTLIALGSDHMEVARSIEYYNSDTKEWAKLLNINIDRTIYRSIMLEDKLMFAGGYKDGEPSSTVQSYDFSTGTMTTLSSLKYARNNHEIATLARHLYVLGGYAYTHHIDSVERYDPLNDTWTDVMPMQTVRGSPAAVVLNEELFVVGGYNETDKHLASVETYNPITNVWTERAAMNETRDDPAIAVIGKFVYVVGGHALEGPLKTAERYEPLIDKWIFVQSMTVPRFRCRGCFFNDSLIVAGGEISDDVATEAVETYDDKKNTWTTLPSLIVPRTSFNLVEIPWRLAQLAISYEIKN